ncbi:class I SAM-dependent methyltransferase [Opitutus sp. GAS368]|jgi:predicted O-methyltransferase YrrM|uniref:class I SAM-dependent methyltransferase n=1 Tax=Opitutus sp. GAS368 TaxID=1882749 RepID=UPI00087BD3A5|nr:class I SAM-dependent methyltransferase [Opitutus sp. GAS368]SDS27168.1 Methyltransferase domain-containing protein [Opitutus sp. GAS368]
MNINAASPRYPQIKADVDRVEGFLADTSIAVWDSLLEYQKTRYITGHLGEIGVYKGKSATILAHHQCSGEELWLVDFSNFIDEAKINLASITPNEIRYIKQKSVELFRSPDLATHRRTFRWFHIDGEHTGQAVATDLAIAHELLADDGIICIDDFLNPAYPQISAATFAFLQAHRFELTLFACGYNKGYMVRPTYARHYLQMIRDTLAKELRARGLDNFTLWKTSPGADFDCWGIHFRYGDRDYRGLDSNPNEFC